MLGHSKFQFLPQIKDQTLADRRCSGRGKQAAVQDVTMHGPLHAVESHCSLPDLHRTELLLQTPRVKLMTEDLLLV